jgi:hypothetical protein
MTGERVAGEGMAGKQQRNGQRAGGGVRHKKKL